MKSSEVDFVEPSPALYGDVSRELRAKILALNVSQAKKLGIGKSELHYLRSKARNTHSFKPHYAAISKLSDEGPKR
jgi:hypothetical protein